MRLRTVILLIVAVLVVLPLGAVGYFLTLGPDDLKQLIVARVAAQTGRQMVINGQFDLDLSLTPSLSAEDITFQNAPWGSRPEMARVGHVEVQLDLMPLFGGTLDITRILLKDADILIETDAAGRSNLDFGETTPAPAREAPPAVTEAAPPGPPPAPSIPVIREVDFDNVTIVLKDQASGDVRTLHVAEVDVDGLGAQSPLDVSVVGDLDAVGFEIVGQLGSPAQMLSPTEAWPVSLVGSAGGISLDIAGTLAEPTAMRGLDVAVQARGPEIAALGHVLGTEIPQAGPFRIIVTVLGDLDGTLALKEIDAELGATEAMTLTARGEVASVFEGTGLDLVVTADGTELEALAAIVGRQIPVVGPYSASATVRGDLYGALAIGDLEAALGADQTVRLEARGRVDSVMQGEGIYLALSARGAQWGRLREVFPAGLGPVSFPDLGPFDMSASVEGDVAGTLAVDGLKVDLGSPETLSIALEGAVASAMDGRGLDVRADVQGQEFKDLIALLPPDVLPAAKELPALGAFRIGLAARGDAGGVLGLDDIDADIGMAAPANLKVEGAVASAREGTGLDLRLHAVGAELGQLNELLAPFAGQDLGIPALGPFDVVAEIRGNVAGPLAISNLDAQVGARKTILVTARGGIDDLQAQTGIALDTRLQGWEMGLLNDLIPPAVRGDTTVPALGPFDVSATVSGDVQGTLSVAGLQAEIGTEDSALITARGNVGDVRTVQDIDLAIGARGGALAALSPVIGVDLPAAGRFDMAGAVKGSLGDLISVTGLQATVGDSSLAGDVSVGFGGPRPSVRANVESRRLDLDALRGLAALDPTLRPQAGPGGSAAVVSQAVGAATPAQGTPPQRDTYRRIFPADPLPVEDLRLLDLDADMQVAELIFDGQRIDGMRAKIALADGRLVLDPLQGGLGGGVVSGTLTFDASVPDPSLAGRLKVQQYDLGGLLAARRIMEGFRGRADIDLTGLSSKGKSVRDLMANLNGTLSVTMGSGLMDAREVNRLSGGAADLARLLLGGGQAREMTVNCIDLRYAVTSGLMRTEKLLFDTDIVIVMGKGDIDLTTERMDLLIGGQPKAKGLAPQVAMKVRGTLADPDFDLDKSSTIGAAGGLLLSEVLGSAVPGSSAISALVGTLSGGADFPCQGIPGASNVRVAERKPSESPAQRDNGGDEEDGLEEKLDDFLKGILGQ